MLTVDDYGKIRRAFRDGMGIREIARTFRRTRRKVRQVLAGPAHLHGQRHDLRNFLRGRHGAQRGDYQDGLVYCSESCGVSRLVAASHFAAQVVRPRVRRPLTACLSARSAAQ